MHCQPETSCSNSFSQTCIRFQEKQNLFHRPIEFILNESVKKALYHEIALSEVHIVG